jgi:hypothetical protein
MTPRIHLSIVQPLGYIHSLGFLDQARFARYQFRQWGAEVTLGKNRLREDAINIIFGAHLGFSAQLKERFTCVFFNLEQLGEGGATVDPAYIDLLRSSAVIDYDVRNLAAYGCQEGDVPVVSFEYAPYLNGTPALPIENRPIDLLFFGSVNERRQAIFKRIEACGWKVSSFDHPLYGDERDHFIRQSKAVFNCHFYESSRFEQARAFHTLSLGTPVISERTDRTTPPPAYEAAVSWLNDNKLEEFFSHEFMTPQWLNRVNLQLQAFATNDPSAVWQIAHSYCQAIWNMDGQQKANKIWRPHQMNIGSGQEYKSNWLNVDSNEKTQPDLVLDLLNDVFLPIQTRTLGGGHLILEESTLSVIHVNNAFDNYSNLPCLMNKFLLLLKPEGMLELKVNYLINNTKEKIIKFFDNYTNQFWSFRRIDSRFQIIDSYFTNNTMEKCEESNAVFLCLRMKRIETTPWEKTISRSMTMDFGGINSDEDDNFQKLPNNQSNAIENISARIL